MKTFTATALVLVFSILPQVTKIAALPATGVTSLASPSNRYEAKLTDNPEGNSTHSSPYYLTITDSNRVIARYPFDGEFASGFWSPKEKYLAIDNHNGHRGWIVWIISLDDGTVFTTHKRVRALDYDPYSKEENFPNIYEYTKSLLQNLTPGVDDYNGPNWPISIAYGWKADNELLMFHELISNELGERENAMIWITSTFKLSASGISVKNIEGKKVRSDAVYPPAVDSVLHWISSKEQR